MDEGTRYVAWLRSSAPYVHAHRGRTFVVHLAGEALLEAGFAATVHDLALLRSLGVRLVVVHGARPQIEEAMRARGIEPRYVGELRVTDAAAQPAVRAAVGAARIEIESLLSMGVADSPMAGARVRVIGANVVVARPVGVRDGIDFGFTGEVRRIEARAIERYLASGDLVLLSPLGHSPSGETFNLRSEDLAVEVAVALHAAKLIFLAPGARLSDARGAPVRQLALARARELQRELRAVEAGGAARVLLEHAARACLNGVERVHVLDAGIDGALLLELYTRDGVGSMVSAAPYDTVRRAQVDDVAGVLALIEPLERSGVLVRRSRERIEAEIGRFLVLERDGALIACAAVYPYAEDRVVELACLAVRDEYRGRGRGDLLLEAVEREARALGAGRVFVLTTRTAHWFKERGFRDATLEELPVSRRELYNYQRNSKVLVKAL